ncbi:MAG: PQQ-binding-like beta-propeller repeat protein [Gemmatimonadota bacterium]
MRSGRIRARWRAIVCGLAAGTALLIPATSLDLSGAARAAEPAKGKREGTAISVTPQMRGAGIVSSGVALPPIPPATGDRRNPVPSWGKPLPYPIVIADRRNNRLIEIAPDKRIVWEMPSPDLSYYRGNEDVNFSEDGKLLAVSEEDNYDLHIVDYDKRVVTWTFGVPDHSGSQGRYLNYPDDSHLLSDGKFLTADIRNCRVLIIDPKTNEIATEWGKAGNNAKNCRHEPPRFLAFPNGVTPTDNGDILVSEIGGAWINRITREGKVVWSAQAPNVRYPSDAFPTVDGRNVIVADFQKPGRVVIFDPATRKVLWQYDGDSKRPQTLLDHPSLARELPDTGDVLIVDDLRHRVIVVDRKTKEIIWQYGVTDTPGHAPGYLFYPDGLDLDVFRDWKAHNR